MEKQAAINYLLQKKYEIITCDPEVWKAAMIGFLPKLFPVSGIEKQHFFEERLFDSYVIDLDAEIYPMWEREQAQGYIQNFIDEIERNGMESKESQSGDNGKISELIHNEFFYAAIVFIGGLCFFLGTFYEKMNHPQIKYIKQPKQIELKQKH